MTSNFNCVVFPLAEERWKKKRPCLEKMKNFKRKNERKAQIREKKKNELKPKKINTLSPLLSGKNYFNAKKFFI